MKLFAGLLALFVSLPLWFYLMYKIMVHIDATELMWFVFWIYVPATVVTATLVKLAEK